MTAAGKPDGLREDFQEKAGRGTKRRKPVAKPFSIRLSDDERKMLLREAGKVSLASHIRRKLFGETASPRRGKRPSRKQQRPSTDKALLAQVLAALGRSELARSLQDIAKAARMGALPVTPELVDELHCACAEIRTMRDALMEALGIRPDDGQ
ncbi:hypothetical protein GGD81_004806 [Rhodobium orientis]|uniref:Bacterial mobilisation domain-containing protein n=1 Tax=Rhodobium orientis TaxID=34017 RepID=A0A327JED3_9HYPH|nr:hypothetical protein [Rhodobium orientis]MBB4305724.1 hypothetical protein [Rhodobium orientis]MBK5950849.1 hypothetical protein [Rhodobium orientis]MBK5950872.1 hypothetical protein [Rhodobium orientis]RAI22304.1 hypothetical protein CH339_23465 [Rhodobium orientis]